MARTDDAQFEHMFQRLKLRAPYAAGFLDWVRRPSSQLIRIPLGVLLILGGIFSILPLLGIWMLPLGLLIMAIDVPILRRPLVYLVLVVEEWWRGVKARRRARRQQRSERKRV